MVQFEKQGGAETVKVVVRCRPMNRREKDQKCTNCTIMDQKTGKIGIFKADEAAKDAKDFTFDGLFDIDSQQSSLYESTAQPLVESVMEGYNGTIFAYGQTGCGKSFSMMGVPSDPELMGIIPRCFQQIFDTISANDDANKKYLVHASYIEIYNEDVRDLQSTNHTSKLDLKEHPEKGVYVQGMSKFTVANVAEITKLMDQGTGNRSVGATLMNADSSRSHSIFIVEVETIQITENGEQIRQGILNLVDLAGSERQEKTGATGTRLKEATKINLSLSALGNVISALVAAKPHIPYRDSKLTRLLQNSLGGNARTVMIAAISPAHDNYEETLSTIRYANRAKNIKNKPKINEDPRDTMLREYMEEITRLRQLQSQTGMDSTKIEGEKVKLIKETKDAMSKLDTDSKQEEEEGKYIQQQLQMETMEQQAQQQVIETQRREIEQMRNEILQKQAELHKKEENDTVDVDHDLLKQELEMQRQKIEEELLYEKNIQAQLETELLVKQEEAANMRKYIQQEKIEKERKQQELQSKLVELEKESNSARKELEKKLSQMEKMLMKGGSDAQNDRSAAKERLMKLKNKHNESEKQRRQLEIHANRLQEEMMLNQQEKNAQSEEIRMLHDEQHQLQLAYTDLNDEFATEKSEYLKTVTELSKELMLYRGLARNQIEEDQLRQAIATARYDDRSGRWLFNNNNNNSIGGLHVRIPPSGPQPPSSANGGNPGSWRDRRAAVSRIGLADTENASPQPLGERADKDWKTSIRGDSLTMGGGRVKSLESLASPSVDVNAVGALPRRPGFRPAMPTTDNGGSTLQRTGTQHSNNLNNTSTAFAGVKVRQAFAPAPSPGAPMSGTMSSPTAENATLDLLNNLPRRSGFQPGR